MPPQHVNHRDGFPLFAGESALHIASVNNQEELLCLLLELAQTALTSAEFATLVRSQAAGVFFEVPTGVEQPKEP